MRDWETIFNYHIHKATGCKNTASLAEKHEELLLSNFSVYTKHIAELDKSKFDLLVRQMVSARKR